MSDGVTYKRYSLRDLETDLENGYLLRQNDPERLRAYSETLWLECEAARKKKKMGRVRIYDKHGIRIDMRIIELENDKFNTLPELGIF